MLWHIYFWLLLLLLAVPLPIKLANTWLGKDRAPAAVKIEEILNTIFLSIGLFGLYGYLHEKPCDTPLFWQAWIAAMVLLSLLPLFWSAKLRHANHTIGKKKTIVLAASSTLLFLPMMVAVYRYASQ